jgi:hypothetical protein
VANVLQNKAHACQAASAEAATTTVIATKDSVSKTISAAALVQLPQDATKLALLPFVIQLKATVLLLLVLHSLLLEICSLYVQKRTSAPLLLAYKAIATAPLVVPALHVLLQAPTPNVIMLLELA